MSITEPLSHVLTDTALAATGGGTLLTLDPTGRPGHADATVLHDDAVLHVRLDATLGTVVVAAAPAAVSPWRERPTRRCAQALR